MGRNEPPHIEGLLAEVAAGRPQSLDELTAALYGQLRAAAERGLRREFGKAAANLTWQPTVLVNETILRVIKHRTTYDSPGHFFTLATKVMRHVLVDYIRTRKTQKRGGECVRIEFVPSLYAAGSAPLGEDDGPDVESLFDAIDRLAKVDARKAEVAQMRLLWGLTVAEIGTSLGVSRATVERDWAYARAWLQRELA